MIGKDLKPVVGGKLTLGADGRVEAVAGEGIISVAGGCLVCAGVLIWVSAAVSPDLVVEGKLGLGIGALFMGVLSCFGFVIPIVNIGP